MRPRCACRVDRHEPRFVAITGGPGAGKTAVLEVVQREFCDHVVVLPEAASILFRGGFPRLRSDPGRRAVQRAIYRVEVELERQARDEGRAAVVLCDRGTVDSAAYWTGPPGSLWSELGTSLETELARYDQVIHLRTPPAGNGYDTTNPLRLESPEEALALDRAILEVWAAHPARTVIDSQIDFLDKLRLAIAAIARAVPLCCRPPEGD